MTHGDAVKNVAKYDLGTRPGYEESSSSQKLTKPGPHLEPLRGSHRLVSTYFVSPVHSLPSVDPK